MASRHRVWGLICLATACGGDGTGPTGPPPPPPPPPSPAPRLIFSTPIAGTPMADLYYGAYRDQGNRDYRCGFKYYAGHAGTDILLRNFTVQDSGVAVLAAAPGRVSAVVDGQFDRRTTNGAGGFGNHVIIVHEEPGLVSMYGHLRMGSIRVAVDASVNRGDTLALVGSSGNSNWPHLHFEVREKGVVVDPWIGPCNQPDGQPSWLTQLEYQDEFRVIDAGLTTEPEVSFSDLLERPADDSVVTLEDDSFLYWLNLFNIQATSLRAELLDESGVVLATGQTGSITTYSVRFFSIRFGVELLTSAGTYAVVIDMTPVGGAVREIARREFRFDPGAVPSRGALRKGSRATELWLSPAGGEPGGR